MKKQSLKKFLMFRDRMNTDMLFGENNGFQTLLVETGVHNIHDVQKMLKQMEFQDQIPDFITEGVTDLLEYLD